MSNVFSIAPSNTNTLRFVPGIPFVCGLSWDDCWSSDAVFRVSSDDGSQRGDFTRDQGEEADGLIFFTFGGARPNVRYQGSIVDGDVEYKLFGLVEIARLTDQTIHARIYRYPIASARCRMRTTVRRGPATNSRGADMTTYLVVKIVSPNGSPFPDATGAALDGSAMSPTSHGSTYEMALSSDVVRGTVTATYMNPATQTFSQKATFNLVSSRPTIGVDGRQQLWTSRLLASSRNRNDFNLEVHFVVVDKFADALDSFMTSFSGPYNVGGGSILATRIFE